jgi:RND family efflux transporter MFP subunit
MSTLGSLRPSLLAALAVALAASLLACERRMESRAEEGRPVRTMTVAKPGDGAPTVLAGRIEAEEEVALAFKIAGRIAECALKAGDRVQAGQVLARLEPNSELSTVRTAQAGLAAAKAQLAKARGAFQRQEALLKQSFTTHVRFHLTKQELEAAQAEVNAAEAKLKAAREQLGHTELKADGPGVLKEVGARAGEAVQPGQAILRLARDGGRDAVLEAPAALLRSLAKEEAEVTVSLADDPAVRIGGRVRSVAAEADPVTGTYKVKVALKDAPEAMRLGVAVNGHLKVDAAGPAIEIPAGALVKLESGPAVWIVDAASLTVSMRPVEVARHDLDMVTISRGLQPGEIVVTAGAHALHAGRKIRLLGPQP